MMTLVAIIIFILSFCGVVFCLNFMGGMGWLDGLVGLVRVCILVLYLVSGWLGDCLLGFGFCFLGAACLFACGLEAGLQGHDV